MKNTESICRLFLGLAAAAFLAGCGEPADRDGTAGANIQGEPIQTAEAVRGEPINTPAAESAAESEGSAEASEKAAAKENAAPEAARVAKSAEAEVVTPAPEATGSTSSPEATKESGKRAGAPDEGAASPEAAAKSASEPTPSREAAAAMPAEQPEAQAAPESPAAETLPGARADSPDSEGALKTARNLADDLQKDKNGYFNIGFDLLASFEYEMPDEFSEEGETQQLKSKEPEKEQIPGDVQGLDRKPVALEGFMLPLKVEDSLVTEMLILRDQSMCCYGTVPKINEWVSVRMTGKGVKPVMDMPVTLYGKLKVGEVYENGYLVGIYEMDADRMAEPLDL